MAENMSYMLLDDLSGASKFCAGAPKILSWKQIILNK